MSRLDHFLRRSSGLSDTTTYRLGVQCSGPSGACASLAISDTLCKDELASLPRQACHQRADRRIPPFEGIIQIREDGPGDELADLTLDLSFLARLDGHRIRRRARLRWFSGPCAVEEDWQCQRGDHCHEYEHAPKIDRADHLDPRFSAGS